MNEKTIGIVLVAVLFLIGTVGVQSTVAQCTNWDISGTWDWKESGWLKNHFGKLELTQSGQSFTGTWTGSMLWYNTTFPMSINVYGTIRGSNIQLEEEGVKVEIRGPYKLSSDGTTITMARTSPEYEIIARGQAKCVTPVLISNIIGDVEIKKADEDEWEDAVEGMWLGKDDSISTGYESQVTVHFGDVSKVTVREMTQVRIAQFFLSDKVATTELQLRIGAVNVEVDKKLVQETTFKVTHPTAVMSVRGTKFQVIVSPENVTTCKVLEGSVGVTPNIHPEREIIVNASQYITVSETNISCIESLTDQELANLQKEFEPVPETDDAEDKPIAEDEPDTENWTDDGSDCWAHNNGVHTMTGTNEDKNRYSYYNQELCDFTYQIDVRKLSGDGPDHLCSYGLYFRGNGPENYYLFTIVNDGRYMIAKKVEGQYTQMLGATPSDSLKTGYNEWNTLTVTARGSTTEFFINDDLVASMGDESFSCGNVGLFAIDSSTSDTPDIVQFRNIQITELEGVTPTPTPTPNPNLIPPQSGFPILP